MSVYPEAIQRLIEKLIKLPGIGRRSAERITEYILKASLSEVKALSEAINYVKEKISLCQICNNLSEEEFCNICKDDSRQHSVICIVENPSDVLAIEKSGSFKGLYHVLWGVISPLEGKGPHDLKINGLMKRIKEQNIQEIIIATDADTEGETTAIYLSKMLRPLGIKISRIGMGIPFGSNLEYMDASTLARALEARREI
ncbi:MAG: recombination mediator RecR [Candidatus Omnitrophica bacterium]|nr:recombination mediator RecR [Candidatus Omnitrophota bacterium]